MLNLPRDDQDEPPSRPRGWFDRLGQILQGEPETREQVLEVLRGAGTRELIDQDSLDMMMRVLQVAELRVRDVMITRSQMVIIDRDSPIESFLPDVIESSHSRFPVVDGDRDRVVGILHAKDLLRYFHAEQAELFNMRDVMRPAVFIPESKRLNVLLHEFRARRNHMAIVVDEYGGTGGLITIEDVLEQIVGEISDEHDVDESEAMIRRRSDNEHVIKALLELEEFDEYFGTRLANEDIDTLGGLIINRLGHMPQRGERVSVGEFDFEVLHADSRRVHLVRATRRPSAADR